MTAINDCIILFHNKENVDDGTAKGQNLSSHPRDAADEAAVSAAIQAL